MSVGLWSVPAFLFLYISPFRGGSCSLHPHYCRRLAHGLLVCVCVSFPSIHVYFSQNLSATHSCARFPSLCVFNSAPLSRLSACVFSSAILFGLPSQKLRRLRIQCDAGVAVRWGCASVSPLPLSCASKFVPSLPPTSSLALLITEALSVWNELGRGGGAPMCDGGWRSG